MRGGQGRAGFDRLLDPLFDELVPTRCQFPRSGRTFLTHPIRSLEARTTLRRLKRRLRPGDDLREFVLDEHLLLYLVRASQIFFHSIRRHRQLSFDLHRSWP